MPRRCRKTREVRIRNMVWSTQGSMRISDISMRMSRRFIFSGDVVEKSFDNERSRRVSNLKQIRLSGKACQTSQNLFEDLHQENATHSISFPLRHCMTRANIYVKLLIFYWLFEKHSRSLSLCHTVRNRISCKRISDNTIRWILMYSWKYRKI